MRGRCGRVIIEEYVGPTLTQLSHVPWLERADYARQLLEMAQEFSYSEFRLYLTDVSLDNFAVDAEGKVRIIDAENIVMVDPSLLDLGKVFLIVYFSFFSFFSPCINYADFTVKRNFIMMIFN